MRGFLFFLFVLAMAVVIVATIGPDAGVLAFGPKAVQHYLTDIQAVFWHAEAHYAQRNLAFWHGVAWGAGGTFILFLFFSHHGKPVLVRE